MSRPSSMPARLLAGLLALALGGPLASVAAAQPPLLNPTSLTKYIDPLPVPGAMPQAAPNYYEIGAWQTQQRVHSQMPMTTVWGYGTSQETASWPAATIVARKGVPIQIRWTNHLPATHLLDYAIDHTIPKAHTTTGVPITTHVHGAEVEPQSDGGPMTWFTPGFAETGHDWTKEVLTYVNTQLPATIWYHDHAFGYTRHNVYAGLAGFYVITDPENEPANLPAAPYDIGLAIQDRMFTADGQLWYPNVGVTAEHPVWIPEFFGDVITVNGKAWPYLEVEARKYRFRLLNGAQARFFNLWMVDRLTNLPGPAFHQIASDGGYLSSPVVLNDPADPNSPRLLMAPGERCEVIVDFSAYAPGTEFVLKNNAKAPFPAGATADPQTVGQVMLFRVVAAGGPDPSEIPVNLATVNRITAPTVTRTMTLNEVMGMGGPLMALLNGMSYHDAPATEFPQLGSTEMWEIVNLTGDAHPIHLHLVQFQLLNRQRVDVRRYDRAFTAANPVIPAETYTPVPVTPYLRGKPIPPDANERGWKDTYRVNPGEVARFLIKFAPQDESPAFAFDATAEPGYVWHCHILEHEENDMMRPYYLVAPEAAASAGASATASVTAMRPVAAPGDAAALMAPRPNPTTAGATLGFSLRNAGSVRLELFSVAGQLVKRLAEGWYEPGEHAIEWDGTDAAGRRLPTGVYLVRFQGDGIESSKKLIVNP